MRKPNLSPGRIEGHLRSRFGQVEDFGPLAEGEESQAFAFRGDGESLVVRVNTARAGFDKDRYAYRHFASAFVPVPEVRSVETLEDFWLCISVRAPGQTLQALAGAAGGYGRAVADVMEGLAHTDVSALSGFGSFDAEGRGPFDRWRDYLAAIAEPDHFDWSAVSGLAPPATVRPLLERVRELAAACPDTRKLVHADFGSNNVLASAGRITAVIDWSEAMLGDPLYDVANIFFWRSWLVCMEKQASFFERHRLPWDADRLACYQLRIGLQAAYEAAADGDADFVRWALHRCGMLASTR